MLPHLCFILCFRLAISQPTANFSARELDSLLQDVAFQALVRPRTGVVYDARIPPNFTGIEAAALRLRSGSLRRRGRGYNEFRIPIGVVEHPYVERLVLVYQNLGNLSSLYYSLPGFTFLAPVLGLLAYDGTNLSATNLPELNVRTSGERISVKFSGVRSGIGRGSSPICVYFGLDGSVGFDNVTRNGTCLMSNQGHISVATKGSIAPAPAPAPVPSTGGGGGGSRKKRSNKRAWIIAASVIGGVAMLAFLAVVIVCLRNCRRRKKLKRMESASALGVALPMTTVGNTKAPVATETRTRPTLESEFVP